MLTAGAGRRWYQLKISLSVGSVLTHRQVHSLEQPMPFAELGGSPIAILCRRACAAQLLAAAILKASPVKERLGVSVAALACERGVFFTAAVSALK